MLNMSYMGMYIHICLSNCHYEVSSFAAHVAFPSNCHYEVSSFAAHVAFPSNSND